MRYCSFFSLDSVPCQPDSHVQVSGEVQSPCTHSDEQMAKIIVHIHILKNIKKQKENFNLPEALGWKHVSKGFSFCTEIIFNILGKMKKI